MHEPSLAFQKLTRPTAAVRANRACGGRVRGIQLVARVVRVGGLMDNSRAVAATIVGAVIGGVAGYLFFTDQGRRMRRQIEPALEDFSRELMSFRATVQKAAGVANEGWKLLNDAIGESGHQAPRFSGPHQSSPF